jgi:hypothetical protein
MLTVISTIITPNTYMKKTVLLIVICLTLIQCNTKVKEGVIVRGIVKNSNQEYIVLTHIPRFRGNLNFDNFNSIGTTIDEKGNFTLIAKTIIHASNYALEFKNAGLNLTLFKGDNLKLEFDLNNLDNSLFATGQGAGKINVLNLTQFKYVPFDQDNTLAEFNSHNDSIISSRLSILNAIYSRDLDNKEVLNASNKSQIKKIIVESPLSKLEYEFLKKQILINIFSISDFISELSNNKLLDSTLIDFTSSAFNCFNEKEYCKIDNIDDWHFANGLDKILHVEFLKSKQKENPKLTYKDWNSYSNSPLYHSWISAYLKSNFKTEVFDKFYADQLAWFMTLGFPYEEPYKNFKEQCTNKKYMIRIDNFKGLLDSGLNNPEYNLGADNLSLDGPKFNSLIESYKGKPIYIIFWSAQYAGSTIIGYLPSIEYFEKVNQGKIEVINICIDEAKYKNLWAARIIDNSWKSRHYFMPIEGNDSTLHKFSSEKISSFCNGGATYSIIDKEGNVYNRIEAPIRLTKDEIKKYLN